jgi:hypothetical protein
VLTAVATVKVELPLPDTLPGLKAAFAPAGEPVVRKVTTPEKPFCGDTVMAYPALPPGITDCVAGIAVTEKSGTAVTVRLTPAVRLRLPLFPVMVRPKLPVVVLAAVVNVRVVDTPAVMMAGLKPTVTPAGAPAKLNPTVPEKPFSAVVFTV